MAARLESERLLVTPPPPAPPRWPLFFFPLERCPGPAPAFSPVWNGSLSEVTRERLENKISTMSFLFKLAFNCHCYLLWPDAVPVEVVIERR